jgi:hypothetical protein
VAAERRSDNGEIPYVAIALTLLYFDLQAPRTEEASSSD